MPCRGHNNAHCVLDYVCNDLEGLVFFSVGGCTPLQDFFALIECYNTSESCLPWVSLCRELLNRQPQQMLLPVGVDGMTLESSVALLDPERRGAYLVGGVKFAEVRLERTPLNAVWTQRRQDATDAVIQATDLNPTLPAQKLVETLVRTSCRIVAVSSLAAVKPFL